MLVFDTQVRPLTEWYDWLDHNGFELGRDYHWSHDPESGMWAVRFRDSRQELMIMLKSTGFIYKENRK
jgi:hypothetical protein